MKFKNNFNSLRSLPKAVIFDWDNTLVDTWPLIAKAINETMRFMKRDEWSLQKVKDNVHKSMRESFPILFGDDWQAAGEIYKNSYRAMNLKHLELLPNAANLLNELQRMNILNIVVSNKIGATLRKEVKNLNLSDKFFSVVGSGDSDFDKPSSAPVDFALKGSGLNLKNDEIWFIGDTIADIDCAYNSGCKPIIFSADEGAISKTISQELIDFGRENSGPIPFYFNHQDLIDFIKISDLQKIK